MSSVGRWGAEKRAGELLTTGDFRLVENRESQPANRHSAPPGPTTYSHSNRHREDDSSDYYSSLASTMTPFDSYRSRYSPYLEIRRWVQFNSHRGQ